MKLVTFSLIACLGIPLSVQFDGHISISSQPMLAPALAVTLNNHATPPQGNVKQATEDGDYGRPPPSSSTTSRVQGGGRNPCLSIPIALVPGDDIVSVQEDGCLATSPADVAITNDPESAIWLYLPNYADSSLLGELTLIQDGFALQQWQTPLSEKSGIMCLRLPYELEASQLYEWRFTVQIQEDNPPDNPKVGGLVQYTEQAGNYWIDNLTSVGLQRIEQPEEPLLADQWQQVLSQEGLGELAQAALLGNCVMPAEKN